MNVVGSNPTKSIILILSGLIFIRNNYYNNVKYYIVNLIDFNSKFIGLYKIKDAIKQSKFLFSDLLFLSIINLFILNCKLINLDKIKYLKKKNYKKQKKIKKQKTKEMGFNLSIGPRDYDNKLRFINRFLKKGYKTRVILNFRGRERNKKKIIDNFIYNLTEKINKNGILLGKPKFFYKNVILNFDSKWS